MVRCLIEGKGYFKGLQCKDTGTNLNCKVLNHQLHENDSPPLNCNSRMNLVEKRENILLTVRFCFLFFKKHVYGFTLNP